MTQGRSRATVGQRRSAERSRPAWSRRYLRPVATGSRSGGERRHSGAAPAARESRMRSSRHRAQQPGGPGGRCSTSRSCRSSAAGAAVRCRRTPSPVASPISTSPEVEAEVTGAVAMTAWRRHGCRRPSGRRGVPRSSPHARRADSRPGPVRSLSLRCHLVPLVGPPARVGRHHSCANRAPRSGGHDPDYPSESEKVVTIHLRPAPGG